MKEFVYKNLNVFKKAAIKFIQNEGLNHGAAIAFYTIFSLPAILLIAIAVGGTFYSKELVQEELMNQVSFLIGTESAEEIGEILKNTTTGRPNWIARIAGISTLIFSATTVFVSLQNSLNIIWQIKPKPKKEVVKFLKDRLLSLAMVVSIGFLLLVSLVIDTVLVLFEKYLERFTSFFNLEILQLINFSVSFVVLTIVFGLIFKVLPDAKIRWKDVRVGAVITTILFSLGKFLIGFYLGNSHLGTAYGAASSTVIILIWIFFSALILLYGAQYTYQYAVEFGKGIKPYKRAVKFQIEEIEKTE